MKKREYKVTMWIPRVAWVKAVNEEEAIEIAQEKDDWTNPHEYGQDAIRVEEV